MEDNGIGMDEEVRQKIFARFFSTKGIRGTGLGLMLTNKLVHEHGGTVSVESEFRKGSKFRISIPAEHPSLASP